MLLRHGLVLPWCGIMGLLLSSLVVLNLRLLLLDGSIVALRLDLLNDLLHELARLAQLLELLLKFEVEAAEARNLPSRVHVLDAREQVVRHIVTRLKDVVLLAVGLRVVGVRNFID